MLISLCTDINDTFIRNWKQFLRYTDLYIIFLKNFLKFHKTIFFFSSSKIFLYETLWLILMTKILLELLALVKHCKMFYPIYWNNIDWINFYNDFYLLSKNLFIHLYIENEWIFIDNKFIYLYIQYLRNIFQLEILNVRWSFRMLIKIFV